MCFVVEIVDFFFDFGNGYLIGIVYYWYDKVFVGVYSNIYVVEVFVNDVGVVDFGIYGWDFF